jgi:hypothetical protein
MIQVLRLISGLLAFVLFFDTGFLLADEDNRQPLFKIERNTNANIIQYDAQIGPDGKLDQKQPVVAYWIRLARQGQKEELSKIQSKFAYGFKADIDRDSNTVTLKMAANIGRLITVVPVEKTYQATTMIDGESSRLEKIFIHATGKGMSTTVDYIQLHGTSIETGDKTFEQFVP